MRRKEALFAVIGGVVGTVLTMTAGSFSPLEAQNEVREVYFDEIRCRQIVVDYPNGIPAILLSAVEDGGALVIMGNNGGGVFIESNKTGGSVRVRGKDGKGEAGMNINEHGGGYIGTVNKHGNGGVLMDADEYGGDVTVYGNDGSARASMSTYDDGGYVSVYKKDGSLRATLK